MLGYMRAVEVTYNQQEDTYHPHIHCIFAVKAQYFTKITEPQIRKFYFAKSVF